MTDTPATPPPPPVPDEIRGWSWGAFLLNWIWGVGNGVFRALLVFVPIFGLVFVFVLGAKGNEWAWRNGRWDSVAHFKRVQRLWAIWGFVILGGIVLLAGGVVGGVFYTLRHSEAYAMAVQRIESSPLAKQALGTPIEAGIPMGSIKVSPGVGFAALNFSVTGPKASGRAYVQAVKQNGAWTLKGLRLDVDGRADSIDLLSDMRVERLEYRLASSAALPLRSEGARR